jgi:hypothetical protein
MKTYQRIAHLLAAIANCERSGNTEWQARHGSTLDDLIKNTAPSGSGVDCGTKLDFDYSNENKLVFTFSYHHMDENGMYCGWTDHSAIVTASLLSGYNLRITGRDKNQIKEYLVDVYSTWLDAETGTVI